MSTALEALAQGLDALKLAHRSMISTRLPRGLRVEICGSSSANGPEADQAAYLAREIANRGGVVVVCAPRSGPNLARRAAEEARLRRRGPNRSRAIVIETSEANRKANHSPRPAVHVSCSSHAGREWLTSQTAAGGATVIFSGGSDTAARFFDLMIAKRTGALPETHKIILIGKQGHQLALLVHHAVESGFTDQRELHWFQVVSGPRQALGCLSSGCCSQGSRSQRRGHGHQRPRVSPSGFIAGYQRELAMLVESLRPHGPAIGVLGTGARELPVGFEETVRSQLTELFARHPRPGRHGGYDGVMRITADVAHNMTTSIAIRARIEGRIQATNDCHSLLLTLEYIDLRQAGLLADSEANVFYPGGGGTCQEALHHSNHVRSFVNLNGYWDLFARYLDHLVDNGLMDQDERGKFRLVDHPLQALAS